MTEQERIEAVEKALRAACEKARAAGIALISGAFQVHTHPNVLVGCCALGAYDAFSGVALPFVDIGPEWDAIEHGWDGELEAARREGLPIEWYDLGARLAAEFKPVPAAELEAA